MLLGIESLILAIVVHDISFSSNSPNLVERFKSKLSSTFPVKPFGQLKSFAGWTIDIADFVIKVDKRSFARKHLQEHRIENANTVHKTLPVGADITYKKEDEELLDIIQHSSYRSIIG